MEWYAIVGDYTKDNDYHALLSETKTKGYKSLKEAITGQGGNEKYCQFVQVKDVEQAKRIAKALYEKTKLVWTGYPKGFQFRLQSR